MSLTKSRLSGKTLFFIFIFLILSTFLTATIINVPADQPTIQAGINIAVNGDTVLVQTGTYVENIDFSGKLITVGSLFLTTQDTTYMSSTIIDGNSSGSVVTFQTNEDSTAILIGFTITDGLASSGSGIFCSNSSPILSDLVISENTTSYSSYSYGGGVYCNNSSLVLSNVTISGNLSNGYSSYGGGICCINSSASLMDVTICSNTASADGLSANEPEGYGGGIYCSNSNLNLTNVTINGNTASANGDYGSFAFGGGIYFNQSNPNMTNVIVSENIASASANNFPNSSGGGIFCNNSNPSLVNVTIENNSVGTYGIGGGICCYNSSPILENVMITYNTSECGGGIICIDSSPSLANVTITNNSGGDGGGGIYCYGSSPILENVTISGNSAQGGGGVYCNSSSPMLQNVTISGNTVSDDGGGIYCQDDCNPNLVNCILWNDLPQEIYFNEYGDPNSITISYTDIQGGEVGIVTNNNGTVNWLEGNIDEDPLFVDPANGDYHLTENSPCIDAGDPASPLDPDGTIADMGAYYYDQGMGIEENYELQISNFKLSNFPNPFNPETTISFDIKEHETGILTIFNIKGQLIESHRFESGKHNYLWDASEQSSGIYFYKLKAGDFEKSKKMLLIK